jgi:mannose-6-phosphate isomerase-like protein (cupin superfamily)
MIVTARSRAYGPITNTTEGLGITRALVGGEGACHWKMLFYGMHLGHPWHTVEFVVIPPGASCGEHTHSDTEEIYYLLSGRATMYLDGTPLEVSAGDLITTPIGSRHAIANHADEDMQMFVVEVFPGSGAGGQPTRIALPHHMQEFPSLRGADGPIRAATVDLGALLTGEWRAFTLAEIPPGGTLGPYRCHEGVEVAFVVQGEATVLVGDERVSGAAGLCVAVPTGLVRSITNTSSDKPLTVIWTEVAFSAQHPGKEAHMIS